MALFKLFYQLTISEKLFKIENLIMFMVCGKLLASWNNTFPYYSKIIFSIAFMVFGAFISIISYISFTTFLGIIIILIGFSLGFYKSSSGTAGKNTINAKLFESCYHGTEVPFDLKPIRIYFKNKPKLLVIRFSYYFSPPNTFISLQNPWSGWNLMFIDRSIKDGLAWGPEFSTVNYIRKDHVFLASVLKRFRELNLEVEYITLDPQYMDIFLNELKKNMDFNSSLKEIIKRINIKNDGTFEETPKDYHDVPGTIEKVNVNVRYEDLYPTFLK